MLEAQNMRMIAFALRTPIVISLGNLSNLVNLSSFPSSTLPTLLAAPFTFQYQVFFEGEGGAAMYNEKEKGE